MHRWTPIATLILVALLASAPVWGPGMVNTRGGGDSPFLLQRTHQLAANLRAGVFPVRWMPDAAYGLGYPFFSYYAALPYYLAGTLALLGVDILTALKMTQTLGFALAALAMYGWMRGMTKNHWAAWLAAVAYTFAPFHLVNVYVRGDSLSEFYAFIFYPLILWALDEVGKSASGKFTSSQAAAALAYAGLLLTHNLSAAIFSPFILLYLVILARQTPDIGHRASDILTALGLGLLLAAWFWLPAVVELGYVQLGPSTQNYFHYSRHFRDTDLIQSNLLFDYSISPDGSTPFAMGLAQATFAAIGAAGVIWRGFQKKLKARQSFVFLGLLISTVMITPLSKPLWDHLPVLPIVQFPWRFLSVQALFAAAATAGLASFDVSRLTFHALRFTFIILIALLLSGSVLLSLHPSRLLIGPANVTTERLQLYELFTQNIGSTIRYEWLPKSVGQRPFTSDALIEPDAPPRAIPLHGASLAATQVEREPTRRVWRISGEGGEVAFPLFYWPGWKARVDGDRAEVWPVEDSGYLALEAPPGKHTVTLWLGRTPVRAIAEMVSLVTAVALLILIGKHTNWRICRSAVVQFGKWFIVPLFAVVWLLVLLPESDWEGENDLTMDFIHMPYLHHNPESIDLGAGRRLTGYTLSAEQLSPGDTLTVTLNWSHVDEPYTATLSLVSLAAVRRPELEPLAEATVPLSPCLSVTTLSLPEDTSRGVYLLQLGETYLRPVRVPRGPSLPADASVLAPFGSHIWLQAAAIAQPAPDRLMAQLTWSAAKPIAANYAISMRLLNAQGDLVKQMDAPHPGYGFRPTSLWRSGELITDRYALALPADLDPGPGYHLVILLYQASTGQPVGQARLGNFTLPLEAPFEARRPPRIFTLPSLQSPLEIKFGEEINLSGYDLKRSMGELQLTLWWRAQQTPQADYTVFVHLFDPAAETLVAQNDAQPRDGAYPTSWWTAGEVVSETVRLPLTEAPEGTYRLAVGLYDRAMTRLTAIGPDGRRLRDDRAILPARVRIEQ